MLQPVFPLQVADGVARPLVLDYLDGAFRPAHPEVTRRVLVAFAPLHPPQVSRPAHGPVVELAVPAELRKAHAGLQEACSCFPQEVVVLVPGRGNKLERVTELVRTIPEGRSTLALALQNNSVQSFRNLRDDVLGSGDNKKKKM